MRDIYRFLVWTAFVACLVTCIFVGCKRNAPDRVMASYAPVPNTSGVATATILGCQTDTQQGTTIRCEQATPWVASPIGVATPIWCIDMLPLDSDHIAVDVDIADVTASDATGHARFQVGWEPVLQLDGAATDPTASGSYIQHSNIGSVMTNTTAQLVQVGQSVCLQVTCADSAGPYCVVHSAVSTSNGSRALAVTAVSPTSMPQVVSTGTTVTISTTGGGTSAIGCSLGGIPFQSTTATGATSVVCTIPAGSYPIVDSGAVGVLTAQPGYMITMPVGFSFTSSSGGGSSSGGSSSGGSSSGGSSSGGGGTPSITQVVPFMGEVDGGTAVTVTGTGLTTSTPITFAGANLVSQSCSSSTTCTGVTPPGASVANIVVASGGGSSATVYSYVPPTGWTLYLLGEEGVTTSAGNITTWADQSGAGNNFTATTTAPPWNANGIATGRGAATFAHGGTKVLNGPEPLISSTAYSIYIAAAPTAESSAAGGCADNVMLGDIGGYWCAELTSANGGSLGVDLYTGSQVNIITTGGVSNSSIQLYSSRFSSSSVSVAINSGGTYTGGGSSATIASVSQPTQLGAGPTIANQFTGQIQAVSVWDVDIGSAADTVVKTAFRNYDSIAP